ncbi:MAG: hypothetical protein K6D96_00015 [Acetatifactor sp.]|nr:hypothetical protein [Acetatifactor sp.]
MEDLFFDELKKDIEDAELVLIGLGEEFDPTEKCSVEEFGSFAPVINSEIDAEKADRMTKGLEKLQALIGGKNHFYISTSVNPRINKVFVNDEKFVATCTGAIAFQCPAACLEGYAFGDEEEVKKIVSIRDTKDFQQFGKCPKCGEYRVFNNIYAPKYDEQGYLPMWQKYTKWLEGTVNKKLVIIELGVGFKFPSIIRFPFEKVASYNKKARFYRINGIFSSLTDTISEKGHHVSKNAIEWLELL